MSEGRKEDMKAGRQAGRQEGWTAGRREGRTVGRKEGSLLGEIYEARKDERESTMDEKREVRICKGRKKGRQGDLPVASPHIQQND